MVVHKQNYAITSTGSQEIDVDSLVTFYSNGSDDDESESNFSDWDDLSSVSNDSASSESRWAVEDNITTDKSSPRRPQRRMSSVAANCAKLVGDIPRIPRRRATLIFNISTGSEGVNERPSPLLDEETLTCATLDLPPMLPQRSHGKKPAAAAAVLRLAPQRMKKMKPPARPYRKGSVEVQASLPVPSAGAATFDDICKQFPGRKCNPSPPGRYRPLRVKRQQPRLKSATAA